MKPNKIRISIVSAIVASILTLLLGIIIGTHIQQWYIEWTLRTDAGIIKLCSLLVG